MSERPVDGQVSNWFSGSEAQPKLPIVPAPKNRKLVIKALVTEMSRRFTPVRIQCRKFHERKQGGDYSVDAYAQDLQLVFRKAYPRVVLGNKDALEMG